MKLDPIRYRSLAAAYSKGMSMRECAREFGVSLERIRQILSVHYPSIIRAKYVGAGKTPAERLKIASRCSP